MGPEDDEDFLKDHPEVDEKVVDLRDTNPTAVMEHDMPDSYS